MKSVLLIRKLLGLVVMTFGLVNASCSLPKWQAVKMIFFAPCTFCMREVYLFTCYFYIFCKLFPDFSIKFENNNRKSFPGT